MSTHSAECTPHNCLEIETSKRAPSMNAMRGRTLIRKTSLLHKIGPMTRRSSFVNKIVLQPAHLAMSRRRKRSGDSDGSAQIALHDPTRIDLLFTMSEITHAATLVRMDNMRSDVFADDDFGTQARRSSISSGGARRDRTDDLMLAKHALSQLSYGPVTRRRMLTLDQSGGPGKT